MQPDIHPELNSITSSLFRVSAKLLVIRDSKLLVVKENEEWFGLPGGGIDHGERIQEGLAREVSEEIEATIDPSGISAQPIFIDSTTIFNGIPRLTLLYTYDSTKALDPEHSELEFQWVDSEEFDALELAPNIKPMRMVILQTMANTN